MLALEGRGFERTGTRVAGATQINRGSLDLLRKLYRDGGSAGDVERKQIRKLQCLEQTLQESRRNRDALQQQLLPRMFAGNKFLQNRRSIAVQALTVTL